jgi:hypothetical protein
MPLWKGYLREVFSTFWKALERTDTLVIAMFILSGIASAWLRINPEHPSWTIALAIFLTSFFVLLVKMPYRLYVRQRAMIDALTERLTPKIRLSFHRDEEGLTRTPFTRSRTLPIAHTQQTITEEFPVTCVRLRAAALSDTTVTGCRAFLTKLQRESPDGRTVSEILLPHSVSLRQGQPFEVYPNVIHAFDILWCSSENNKLVVPECTWPLNLRELFEQTGTYHFTIMLNAEGGSSNSITLAIGWPGQWDKITRAKWGDPRIEPRPHAARYQSKIMIARA